MDLIHDGKMTKDQVDDLGDVITGKVPVHRRKDEIVVYFRGRHAGGRCGLGHCLLSKRPETGNRNET